MPQIAKEVEAGRLVEKLLELSPEDRSRNPMWVDVVVMAARGDRMQDLLLKHWVLMALGRRCLSHWTAFSINFEREAALLHGLSV